MAGPAYWAEVVVTASGDDQELAGAALILGGTGHFEVIAPGSPVWSQVEAFLLEQLKVEK